MLLDKIATEAFDPREAEAKKGKKEPYYVPATPPETPTNALNKKLLKQVHISTPPRS